MRALLAAMSAATLALAPAHPAAAGPVRILATAPGYPGTAAEAQPHMDAFAAAVVRRAGLAPGSVEAAYEPTEAGGLAALRGGAHVALVPLPFLVAHGESLGLRPRLAVATEAGGTEEVWLLVARKGRVRTAADLAGFRVVSIAGYAPAFVRAATGAFGRIPDSAEVVASSQVLSALRKAAAGEDVAVLLDGAQSAAFPTLPFAADLEVVARSGPLPGAVVATVGQRLPASRWKSIEAALLGLSEDPAGAAALQGIRMTGFRPLDPKALAAAGALASGAPR
jgi:hypothetical protein